MNGLAVLIGAGILSLWQSRQCTGASLSHRICFLLSCSLYTLVSLMLCRVDALKFMGWNRMLMCLKRDVHSLDNVATASFSWWMFLIIYVLFTPSTHCAKDERSYSNKICRTTSTSGVGWCTQFCQLLLSLPLLYRVMCPCLQLSMLSLFLLFVFDFCPHSSPLEACTASVRLLVFARRRTIHTKRAIRLFKQSVNYDGNTDTKCC